jgi:hypothetical protein
MRLRLKRFTGPSPIEHDASRCFQELKNRLEFAQDKSCKCSSLLRFPRESLLKSTAWVSVAPSRPITLALERVTSNHWTDIKKRPGALKVQLVSGYLVSE